MISIIESVVALAEDNNIVLVSEYMNIPATYVDLITDANAYALIDIVKAALDLRLVNVLALDIYNGKYFNTLMGDENILALLDLQTVYGNNATLIAEVKEVLTAVQSLVDTSVVTIGAASLYNSYINSDESVLITVEFAEKLAEFTDIKIEFQDERLTTVQAERMLISGGVRRDKRKKVIDKVAATLILQAYLDKKNY